MQWGFEISYLVGDSALATLAGATATIYCDEIRAPVRCGAMMPRLEFATQFISES
jgi:hypothetical protein